MDNTLFWILLGVITFVLLVPFLIGLFITPLKQTTRVELIKAPLEKVWLAISEPTQQTQWRNDLKGVQVKDDGEGLYWVEQPVRGTRTTIRKTKEIEQQELILQMERYGKVRGTRKAILRAVPGGTRVTFTESTENRNPLSRFNAHVSSRLDKNLNHYIKQLKQGCLKDAV